MYQSTTTVPKVLIDLETGRVLDGPPSAVTSRKYLESHPFVEISEDAGTLYAGPDALKAQRGETNDGDYVEYVITREVDGFLHLERIA